MVSEALTFLWSAAESFCIFSACQLVESFYPCSQLPGCGWHCWWYRSQISHHTTRFSKLYCWIELEIYWYQVVLISKLSQFHSKALELWIGSIWFLSPPIINEGERWEMEAIFLVNLLSWVLCGFLSLYNLIESSLLTWQDRWPSFLFWRWEFGRLVCLSCLASTVVTNLNPGLSPAKPILKTSLLTVFIWFLSIFTHISMCPLNKFSLEFTARKVLL